MRNWLISALILSFGALLPLADAGKKSKADDDEKEGLEALQELIGGWKGTADDKAQGFWTEKSSWSWRFKDKDRWMSFELEKSKLYKGGEVRYLADKSKYQLTLIDKADKKAVYLGALKKKDYLIVERVNPDTSDTEKIELTLVANGDRLNYTMFIKPDGRTLWKEQTKVGYTREGVTFGVDSGGKKVTCVVTGGLGTIPVTYMGTTYYVCCSGCRDAFNENPAKIIAEYMKKKKK
jgi:hypothetical protein